MAKIKKTDNEVEAFEDELQRSNEEELKNMRRIVSSSRKKKKTSGGSCVSSRDKMKGEIRECSKFEIELANIFRSLQDMRLPKKEVMTYTDMILSLVVRWKEVERKLLEKKLVKESSFLKELGGGFYLTSPLVILAIRNEYSNELESIYGKKMSQIPDNEILKNTSSLLFQVFKVFNVLGLVGRDKSSKPYQYIWNKSVLNFSFEQMTELLVRGRELDRRIERGEIEGAPQKIEAVKRRRRQRQKEEPSAVKQDAKEEKLIFKRITVAISFSIDLADPEWD